MFKTFSLSACATAMLFAASGAMAAPADDAKTHFQAIGSGDLSVLIEGKAPIKVRYVLTFREGKIVSETWQIDPKLAVAAAY